MEFYRNPAHRRSGIRIPEQVRPISTQSSNIINNIFKSEAVCQCTAENEKKKENIGHDL